MKILVTGATGFVGSNLARSLTDLGHEVLTTGRSGEQSNVQNTRCIGYRLDELDSKQLEGVEIVYHQAANNDTQIMDEEVFQRDNVEQPMKLFEQLQKIGCKKYVFASSTAIYGNSPVPYDEWNSLIDPKTSYAKSKQLFEFWALHLSLPGISTVGLRYCNIYGPGESHKDHRASMIHQIIKQVKSGQRPKLFRDGEQRRDWVYIDDVIQANLNCLNYWTKYQIFNIAYGKSYSFNEVVSVINQELETNLEPEWIDNPYSNSYQNHTECKIEKACKHLAYTPTYDLKSGIRNYLEHWDI